MKPKQQQKIDMKCQRGTRRTRIELTERHCGKETVPKQTSIKSTRARNTYRTHPKSMLLRLLLCISLNQFCLLYDQSALVFPPRQTFLLRFGCAFFRCCCCSFLNTNDNVYNIHYNICSIHI